MAGSGNIWTVPFGGGIGRIMKLGFQPVNIPAQFYSNAVTPAGGSPWCERPQIAFLFRKFTKRNSNNWSSNNSRRRHRRNDSGGLCLSRASTKLGENEK